MGLQSPFALVNTLKKEEEKEFRNTCNSIVGIIHSVIQKVIIQSHLTPETK